MQELKSIKRENSKKAKLKAQSGITLIALIITIIVLLILAGVALSTLTGDSGILSNAEKAKEQTTIGNIKEQVGLAVQSALINSLGNSIEEANLQEELDKVFGEGEANLNYNSSKKEYTVIVDRYEVSVTNRGNVGDVTKPDVLIKFTLSSSNTTLNAEELVNVSEVTSENVPIPEGFYRVGGTKDTGVVISDVEGDDLNNDAGGNQFVWVPVNQNQKLTLEVTSKEEITGITLIGPDGTETEVTPSGKLAHSQEIAMTKNGVYTVNVTTASETKIAQKRVTSLYAQDFENDLDAFYNEFKIDAKEKYKTAQEFENANGGATIYDLAGEDGVAMYMLYNLIYIEGMEEEFKAGLRALLNQTNNNVDSNQNTASVNQYGGFYIARFEAGDGTTATARDSSSSDENTLVSQKGEYIYNYVDLTTAKELSTGMYNSSSYVTSQLITGAGWDRTMNWLVETGIDKEKVIIDSRSWGNYTNSTGNAKANSGDSNMNYTTGRSEYWKANNIYDLAGNATEWTQEQSGTDSMTRGGNFNNEGDIFSASVRYDTEPVDQHYFEISFRTQLYINVE